MNKILISNKVPFQANAEMSNRDSKSSSKSWIALAMLLALEKLTAQFG